jgi:LmbE family N-acetylglucosaminyl deacetylase
MNPRMFDLSSVERVLRSPLCSVDEIAAEPILVVAPHPDDETLGCGGAIASLRALGRSIWVLVMSDGTMSHPNSATYPAPKLRALRESETQHALNLLGVNSSQITFFQMPDGALPVPGAFGFECALERCQRYLSAVMPSIVFVPWRFDPHPDHRATWQLINQALVGCALAPRVIEYPIWDWDRAQHCPYPLSVTQWRLDISDTVQIKQRAIAAYRSQTTSLIQDDPQGFRLTPQMLENFTHPWELYLEET